MGRETGSWMKWSRAALLYEEVEADMVEGLEWSGIASLS